MNCKRNKTCNSSWLFSSLGTCSLYFLNLGRRLSEQAQNAETTADLWGCFVTDELLEVILLHTNEKIRESEDKQEGHEYSSERLKKSPHLKETDLVSNFTSYKCYNNWKLCTFTTTFFLYYKRIQRTHNFETLRSVSIKLKYLLYAFVCMFSCLLP